MNSHTRRDESPSGRMRFARIGLAATLFTAFVFSNRAESYRFYSNGDDELPPESAEDAVRWRAEIWPPGGELSFFVAADPIWDETTRTPEQALPFVEQALAIWSETSGTDIRWNTVGVRDGPGAGRDGQNGVTVNEDPESEFSFAWTRFSRKPGGVWELTECDVVMSQGTVEALDSWGLSILIHEFGHCLGLAHAAAYPSLQSPRRERSPSAVWQDDPQMSYGWGAHDAIADDDAVGARLLRPAPDWIGTTGSIGGQVWLDDAPAPFVHVLAVPIAGGAPGGGVGIFTGEDGSFLIEGLPPAEYLLWVHPIGRLNAHETLVSTGSELEFDDRLYPVPIQVSSGRHVERTLAVRTGREQ